MKRVGLIGLGDMGIGMAANFINAGLPLCGFDLRAPRLKLLADLGGQPITNCQDLSADVIFLMVMNGRQIRDILIGEGQLLENLEAGATLVVTATIQPTEMEEVAQIVASKPGIGLIDSPVSGGKAGADSGSLTLMQAGDADLLKELEPVFRAISSKIYCVGSTPGQGQKTKAALQALIGCSFTAVFEALVLGTKAGVPAEVLFDVFSHSSAASPLTTNCMKLIMARQFEGTGSQIGTMYKDLGITMAMARNNGAMMPTTAAAYELFQAGISLFPGGDNWSIIKLLEQIAGVEVKGELRVAAGAK